MKNININDDVDDNVSSLVILMTKVILTKLDEHNDVKNETVDNNDYIQ